MNIPSVKKNDWIIIGKPTGGNVVHGLVMSVSSERLSVGYYQNQMKAIKEDVVWKDDHWEFEVSGPNGLYLRGPEEAAVKRGPPR